MKILFIDGSCPHIYNITTNDIFLYAKMMQHSGHNVQILTCNTKSSVPEKIYVDLPFKASLVAHEGILNIIFTHDEQSQQQITTELYIWMRNQCFDIIHVFYPILDNCVASAIHESNIPYIISISGFSIIESQAYAANTTNENSHEFDSHANQVSSLHQPNKQFEYISEETSPLIAKACFRICPSSYAAKRYRTAFPTCDFTVVPEGVGRYFFSQKRVVYENKSDKLTLGYIGSSLPQQGLNTLLESLLLETVLPLRFMIICDEPDLDRNPFLQSVMAKHQVELVNDLTPQNIASHLSLLDLLCLPTEMPFSSTRILDQAASSGVPVIAANVGAQAEWITQHNCGQTLPQCSTEAWSTAIAKINAHPQQISSWRHNLPLPFLIEEETFIYEALYRKTLLTKAS